MANNNGAVAEAVRISFDLDQFDAGDFTWGDMEDLQDGKFSVMRRMIERYAVVEGVPEGGLTTYLRGLKFAEVMELSTQLVAIINEKQNPSKNGKNSEGGSPNTSTPKRASRR
jgi:hypothetical protein